MFSTKPYLFCSLALVLAILMFLGFSYAHEEKFVCGDLLSTYAKKPKHLEFIKASGVRQRQTVCEALYKVEGKYALEVEKFLRKNYKMAEVVYFHGHFENKNAGYGYFYHKAFKEVNGMSAGISMGGIAKSIKDEKTGRIIISGDKSKVDFMYVSVDILDI